MEPIFLEVVWFDFHVINKEDLSLGERKRPPPSMRVTFTDPIPKYEIDRFPGLIRKKSLSYQWWKLDENVIYKQLLEKIYKLKSDTYSVMISHSCRCIAFYSRVAITIQSCFKLQSCNWRNLLECAEVFNLWHKNMNLLQANGSGVFINIYNNLRNIFLVVK